MSDEAGELPQHAAHQREDTQMSQMSQTSSPTSIGQSYVRSANPPSGMPISPGPKRIIVCCDGTWQDGFNSRPSKFSNIIKLSRMMEPFDTRVSPPIAQIVYYQSGIGTQPSKWAELYEGATGASLGMKVQEAYGFIAHNYQPGDEIFLFGFSRGAYTARMTAAIIGDIGVLDVHAMDHFAQIFMAYNKKRHYNGEKEGKEAEDVLKTFTDTQSKSHLRADVDGDTFSVQCVGVFDTVGALGIPGELAFGPRPSSLFGFPDNKLGNHVKHAFHAMALHETRDDFTVTKFEQSREAKLKGQVLNQVWFSGSHSDVGGGYNVHDLSDITLAWMASQLENILALNTDYMKRLPRPTHPWGAQPPHDPIKGIFQLSKHSPRELPKPHLHAVSPNSDSTFHYFVPEAIHPSVLEQDQLHLSKELKALLNNHPCLLAPLSSLEEDLVKAWSEIDWTSVKKAEVKDVVKNSRWSTILNKVLLLVRAAKPAEVENMEHGPDPEKEWISIVTKELMGRHEKEGKPSGVGKRGTIMANFGSKRWSKSSVTSSTLTGDASTKT